MKRPSDGDLAHYQLNEMTLNSSSILIHSLDYSVEIRTCFWCVRLQSCFDYDKSLRIYKYSRNMT